MSTVKNMETEIRYKYYEVWDLTGEHVIISLSALLYNLVLPPDTELADEGCLCGIFWKRFEGGLTWQQAYAWSAKHEY